MNRNKHSTKPAPIPRAAMTLLLTLTWMLPATGCKTVEIREIPTDRYVVTVKKDIPFTPPADGKFVPTARWNEMLETYIRASQAK